MLDHTTLSTLRRAASLIHAVPGSALRVRNADRTVLSVRRDAPLPRDARADVSTTPCGFRGAVARAHALSLTGGRLRFLDLDGTEPLTWHVDPGPQGTLLANGLLQFACSDQRIRLFATTLDVEEITTLDPLDESDPGLPVRLHRDSVLDVTLVHTATSLYEPVDDGVLSALHVRCAVEEMLSSVPPMAPGFSQ